ncbi:MAG: sigma-70 family RNA polymerase sigma factor, partial [Blautia sp.]|nr:sigma-70 family RNA polymerase sigma factor [Blautia sp.]
VDSFDETKGIRLATYCARCIENELLMLMRSEKKNARDVYLYDSIGSDKEGNEINLLDIIESPPVDVVENCFIKENISCLLASLEKTLSPREYEVICLRYGLFGEKELTQREIAGRLSISRSYVSRIEKNALQKLRTLF